MIIKGSPKGRRPPSWHLTHLGSGLLICRIEGKVSEAFVIASEIADCGDWDFDGPDGWKNRDLELPHKVVAIGKKYPKAVTVKAGHHPNTETVARAVAMARA